MPSMVVYVQLRGAEQPTVIEADSVEENKEQFCIILRKDGRVVRSMDMKYVICWWKRFETEDRERIR
jgi:hypothetical protein